MRLVLILFLSVLCLIVMAALQFGPNAANAAIDAEDRIAANFKTFETLLNEGDAPEKLMTFLHETISNEAEFRVRISNEAAAGQGQGANDVTLNKADYINSYLYGPRQVEDYQAQIEVLDITMDKGSQRAHSQEVLVERGYMRNPAKPNDYSQGFVSRTACQSEYTINAKQKPVLEKSVCKTDIAFEQGV